MFVSACEEGTFTAAAARENATQSGVSQHINRLERSMGVSLFIRGKSGVSPTPAGQRLYKSVVEMLKLHHTASQAVRAYGKGFVGAINVGLVPALTQVALAPALASFVEDHPNVRVLVTEGYSGILAGRVLGGQLEAAVVPSFLAQDGLSVSRFCSLPEVFISSVNRQLAHHEPVNIGDLGPLKLIVPSLSNSRRRNIEAYCAENGGRIDRLLELDSIPGTIELVAQSDWSAILPLPAVANEADGRRINVNPVKDDGLTLDLVVITPATSSLTPAAQAFYGQLATTLKGYTHQWGHRKRAVDLQG